MYSSVETALVWLQPNSKVQWPSRLVQCVSHGFYWELFFYCFVFAVQGIESQVSHMLSTISPPVSPREQ